jgi:hypothetical protein
MLSQSRPVVVRKLLEEREDVISEPVCHCWEVTQMRHEDIIAELSYYC